MINSHLLLCTDASTHQNAVNSFMTEALSYRNQFTDLRNKLIDWFLYDNGLRHERVNNITRSSYDSHVSLNQYGGENLSNLLKFQCSPSL